MAGFISRWWTFLQERFEPFGSTLTIAAFCGANALVAWPDINPGSAGSAVPWGRWLGGMALVWLIFFHMRLFDEVKDYQTDREVNPERPLPRGLISLNEFGAMTLLVIMTEFSIAANLGWHVVMAYTLTLAFTLMMRQEFFIGDWLRPKMEAYAISHTFSASMMGMTIGTVVTGQPPMLLPNHFLVFVLGNWFIFNVFEFGRKTFAAEEERAGVDSYSQRLYPWGAVVLLLVNLGLGFLCCFAGNMYKFGAVPSGLFYAIAVLSGLVALSGVIYALRAGKFQAKLYRGTVTFFLLAYHLAVIAGIVWR